MTDAVHPRILKALRAEVSPFLAMDVMAAARDRLEAGGRVMRMEIGEPGFPPPRLAVEAAQRMLAEGGTIGYTDALGLPQLRRRIARHYKDAYGLTVAPSRVAVTIGSSGGFILLFQALFDPGDRVAITMPAYPPYRNTLKALGITPVEIPTRESTRWALTAEQVEEEHAREPLKGVLVMSPGNPTGTVIDAATFRPLAETCRRLGIHLISDEIYHGLTYDGVTAQTALAFSDEAMVVNSFSKYYGMTGWRIGWLILPEDLVRPIERLAQNFFISAPMLSQVAALAAFDATDELEERRAAYARNRARLIDALPAMGLDHFAPPDGAFYLYCDVGRLTNDSLAFARAMLAETGVAATPGVDFDPQQGGRYLRFSFAGAEADVEDAITTLGAWLKQR
ncbi:1-aminocyclopropane-1-carboxylate deaminase [Agaricicola taiwanensis]|uniref:Aminotransferase n=1 Tax=Agaricicola taiwanensis TaxID=591372 RepID=A0A8J3DTA0_9RHOB|nr:aminotransferase class I/II-fold pyridoxal phosphate-dependent enzyme [Agaricicola taiwanensis]GGE43789.1 1-aminocyclopropane-1-carboxylate deaminase [Agaricicola taiwanensis]